MKIYRAVIKGYYGVDDRFGATPWDKTIDIKSVWYSDEVIAKQHFKEFNALRDNMLEKCADLEEKYGSAFSGTISIPHIEEQEIHESFVQRLNTD